MQISKEQVLRVLEAYLKKVGKSPEGAESKAGPDPAQVNKLCHELEEIPEVREERIHPIEEKMRDGQYTIDDEAVAEKIVFRATADTLIIKNK